MSTVKKFYEKLFGDNNTKVLKQVQPIVAQINALEADMEALSDEALKGKTAEFKDRLAKGETLDDILPEAFAVVRETGKRLMKMRHYDVQLIGGIALHRGMIAEMRTGEGKTLVATLPAYLNALAGKGVHVITVNDYLAKRDAVWMGQVYDFLGLSVGIVQSQRVTFIYDSSATNDEDDKERDEKGSYQVEYEYLRAASRKEAYACDITYGTNNEFGFDYLRDNMVQEVKQMVMRPGSEMAYAIIDEIDSILIDEARTPLIISAPASAAADQYYTFAKLVKQLDEENHYNVDEKLRSATLSAEGIQFLEEKLGISNLYAEGGMQMIHHIEQALRAEVLFKRDKEYVLDNGEVVIIDEFTGRKMPGRRYSQGLHQAIEAKEGVKIQQESRTLATITYQNLFRMYEKLSGMTGTAATEEEEFRSIYELDVLVIPTNKPDARIDLPDRIYKNKRAKFNAVVEQIKICKAKEQPILVGTISVEENEALSSYLTANGIKHEALNAKNHEREGEIVALAGQLGAVTLATNMAGRGVDIKLGGPEATDEEYQNIIDKGGLFVLGTERHESRRIDNQLRGRAARQGDNGETQFFVSTEDDLMRIFSGDRLKTLMTRLNVPEDMPIEQKMVSKMLENAQKKVESHHFDSRKHLLNYDDILNKQREVIYAKRREVLGLDNAMKEEESEDISEKTDIVVDTQNQDQERALKTMIMGMVEEELRSLILFHTSPQERGDDDVGVDDEWNLKEIYETTRTIFPLTQEDRTWILNAGDKKDGTFDEDVAREALQTYLMDKAGASYANIEKQAADLAKSAGENEENVMPTIERQILLRSIDNLWVDHLVAMNYLRTGIGLRGYGQQDPLIAYKKESYQMFIDLQANIQKEVVYSFFKVGVSLQLAPTLMADDKLVMQGAEKTSKSKQAANQDSKSGPGVAKKKKMSKKERRKMKREGKK